MEWLKRAWRTAFAAEGIHGFFTGDLAKLLLWPLWGAAVTIICAPEMDMESNPAKLKTMQMGVGFKNNASFIIYYEIERLDCQFMGRVALEKPASCSETEIPPNTSIMYRDSAIEINLPLSENLYIGKVYFKVAYWRNLRKKSYIERALQIEMRYNAASGQYNITSGYR